MSLRRPTAACLLFIYFISPLCGVTQTPDCGILFPLHYCSFMLHINNLFACMRDFIYDWRCDHRILQCMNIIYIIPVFIMFASTFKVLTGLFLAIVLARFLAWRGTLWWQPRNLRNGGSSVVKIGVIQVSCSCGKWSPIDADDPQNRFRHQPLETKCCTPRPQWPCTTYFVLFLEFLYQVGTSSANSNPGAGEHKAVFLGIYIPKTRSWQFSRSPRQMHLPSPSLFFSTPGQHSLFYCVPLATEIFLFRHATLPSIPRIGHKGSQIWRSPCIKNL